MESFASYTGVVECASQKNKNTDKDVVKTTILETCPAVGSLNFLKTKFLPDP